MESPKKIVEGHEEKGDIREDMGVAATEESCGDQNVEIKRCITTESDGSAMSSSKPSDLMGSVMDAGDQEFLESGKNKAASDVDAEEEDEDVEKEKRKGIYDMPLEVEGKRERHKVDRISIATPTIKKHASSMQMADGIPLGEIAYIEDQLKKHSSDELKTMHRVLYGHPGKATTVKKEIRKFRGFAFKEDSLEFKKKMAFLQKLSLDQLKIIKSVLGLHSSQTKDAVVTTIMVFLMKTVDHARRVAKKRKSSSKTHSATKRAKKAKDEIDHTDDEDENEGDKKKSTSKTPASGVSVKKPKKTRQSANQKKIASKSDSRSESDSKKKKSRKESKDSDEDTSSSSSVETTQETRPSEKELENVIEELLSQVDLSQVSMKQMCQAVIEKFPGTNIGNRVDYLKGLIKQSLATK